MNIRRFTVACATLLTLGASLLLAPAFAHHASSPFYDADKPVEIEGVVTRFVFRNPHAALFLDVTDADGNTVEWQVELGAPVSIRRLGWTPETLPIGMIVRVAGPSSRAEGSHGVLGRRVTKPDGSPVVEGGRRNDPTPTR